MKLQKYNKIVRKEKKTTVNCRIYLKAADVSKTIKLNNEKDIFLFISVSCILIFMIIILMVGIFFLGFSKGFKDFEK